MKWKLLNKQEIKDKDQLLKILLNNRGLKTKKEIDDFLDPKKIKDLTHKDLGLSSSEIKKAISRIKKAIKNKERIIVYGDYDADGICGVAVLWEALFKLKADALPFIPSRDEGYGLKSKKVKEFAKDGVKLIITVDNGIRNKEEVAYAKSKGLEVIITDHHILPENLEDLPDCLIINPANRKDNYPWPYLAGVGVSFKLVSALVAKSKLPLNQKRLIIEKSLDLVAVGTIADMVSLLGENRLLVKQGLQILNQGKRHGLSELVKISKGNNNKKLENTIIPSALLPL